MLRRRVEELLNYVESIKDSSENLDQDMNFFARWKNNRKHKNKENKLQREMFKLEKEYEIYETEINLSTNPVGQVIKLSLGTFAMIFSFCILI